MMKRKKLLVLGMDDTLEIHNTSIHEIRLEMEKDYIKIEPQETIIVMRDSLWKHMQEQSARLHRLLNMSFSERLTWAFRRRKVDREEV